MRTDHKLEEIPFPLRRTVRASNKVITIKLDFDTIRRQMRNWNFNYPPKSVDTSI